MNKSRIAHNAQNQARHAPNTARYAEWHHVLNRFKNDTKSASAYQSLKSAKSYGMKFIVDNSPQ